MIDPEDGRVRGVRGVQGVIRTMHFCCWSLITFGFFFIWIGCSIYGMAESINAYTIVPCQQVNGKITKIEQLEHSFETSIYLTIKKDGKIIDENYNIRVTPAIDFYRKGDSVILHKKCLDFVEKYEGYTFNEQSHKKSIDQGKGILSVISFTIALFYGVAVFGICGSILEQEQKREYN